MAVSSTEAAATDAPSSPALADEMGGGRSTSGGSGDADGRTAAVPAAGNGHPTPTRDASCGVTAEATARARATKAETKAETTAAAAATTSMGVGSFVDRAFSGALSLPGVLGAADAGGGGGDDETGGRGGRGRGDRKLLVLPSLATAVHNGGTGGTGSNGKDRDAANEGEGGEFDAAAEEEDEAAVSLSYYPLVPLLLSLVLPLLVLYQSTRTCLSYSSPLADFDDTDLNDVRLDTHQQGRGSGSNHQDGQESAAGTLTALLQSMVVGHVLRLGLACLLVRYGPALKDRIDDVLQWIANGRVWQYLVAGRVWQCMRHISKRMGIRIGAFFGNDDTNDYKDSGDGIGEDGSNARKYFHQHLLQDRGTSSSSSYYKSTSHIPALKGLAALTFVALLVHPEGITWFVLAKVWHGICYATGAALAVLAMIRDGTIPSLAVTVFLLALFLLVRSIRLSLLLPPPSTDESLAVTTADHGTTGKPSGKGRKRGKKGRGRQSGGSGGRARIRGSHSHSHSHLNSSHHHRHQNQSNHHPIKSSASTVSASSVDDEERRMPSEEDDDDDGGSLRNRLASSDVSVEEPDHPPSLSSVHNGSSAPILESDSEDIENSRGRGGSGSHGGAAAVEKMSKTSGVASGSASAAASSSKAGRKKKRGKKGSKQQADAPPTPTPKSPSNSDASPRTPQSRGNGRTQNRGAPQGWGGGGKAAAVSIPQLSPTVIKSIRPVVAKEQYKPNPDAKNIYHIPAKGRPLPLFSSTDVRSTKANKGGKAKSKVAVSRNEKVATDSSSPSRYPVPNYASSYLYSQVDKRYPPGKVELAAFLAQAGLVGLEIADLLDDTPDVDALAELSEGHFDAYGVTKEKQGTIAVLLKARHEQRQEEKAEVKKAAVTVKKTEVKKSAVANKDEVEPSRNGEILPGQKPLTPPRPPHSSTVRAPPGLDPVLSGNADMLSTKPSVSVRPIGSGKPPIGSETVQQQRSPFSMPPLPADDSNELRAPLGIGATRARCRTNSGEEIGVFGGAGANIHLTIPTLSPGSNPFLDSEATVLKGGKLDEEHRIEADLQELGDHMVDSILDF